MIDRRKLLQIGSAASLLSAGFANVAKASSEFQPIQMFGPSQGKFDINSPVINGSSLVAQMEPEYRQVKLYNLHTGEKTNIVYKEKGKIVGDALSELNYFLRDYRTGDVKQMDVGLLDLIDTLSRKLEVNTPFNVISGYRSPATNAMLHERSNGVAKHSLHMEGKAMDIRVPGVALTHLRNVAKDLRIGGVGYYASSDFVHVDTGKVRYW